MRRLAAHLEVRLVITGWMLSDGPADRLSSDLPNCVHILVARQGQLDQCSEGVVGLPAPLSKNDLISTIRTLMNDPLPDSSASMQKRRGQEVVEAAKRLLMDRNHMSESQAHRFLQKTSMDSCITMVQTAQRILNSDKVF